FDIGTRASVPRLRAQRRSVMIGIGIGGALVEELPHELPITRARDRSLVVGARHDRRGAVRLCGPRRGIYRRWTGLRDSGTGQRQRHLRRAHQWVRIRSAGTRALPGADGGGTGRRGGGTLRRKRIRLPQWLRPAAARLLPWPT